MKTLIELFDYCQLENVVATLKLSPEKVVFVGFKEVMTNKKIDNIKKFFQMKQINMIVEYHVVGRYDYDAIVDKFNMLIDNNPDCLLDVTGGKELLLTAIGEVSARRNIPMVRYDFKTGEMLGVANCKSLVNQQNAFVSIDEIVSLNGGAVVYDDVNDFCWELTDDFKRDVEIIWGICRQNCRRWNKQAMILKSFEKYGEIDDLFSVCADLNNLRENHCNTMLDERIIWELRSAGLLLDYKIEKNILTFRYKNEQVYRCISKAGNILEVYAYMLFCEMGKNEPELFSDIDTGVYVDWDGVLHDEYSLERDTRNEIDIILTKMLKPIFISCKNGEVHKEALYEMNTVAGKYGGEHTKKVLLTTYISRDEESKKYILQRARDMGIYVISGVDTLDRYEFENALRNIIR